MRKIALLTALALLATVAYAAWPVLTAYQIRHAAKTGDSATLARKVEWPRVRESLKASIATLQAEAATRKSEAQPSLWSRIKSSFVPYMAESMIDRYVTAEGVANLDGLKAMWRKSSAKASQIAAGDLAAAVNESTTEPEQGPLGRFLAFYSRIERARFHGLDKVEFWIADRTVPERRYVSRFELANLEWKLVSVRIAGAGF